MGFRVLEENLGCIIRVYEFRVLGGLGFGVWRFGLGLRGYNGLLKRINEPISFLKASCAGGLVGRTQVSAFWERLEDLGVPRR